MSNRLEGGPPGRISLPKERPMLSFLLLLANACAPPLQGNPTAEEIFRKVREVLPKSPRYAADFEESRTLGPTTAKATGRVFVGGGRLLRLEVETRLSPAPPGMAEKGTQTVVADGEYLWVEAPAPFSSEKVFFRGRLDDLERQGPGGRLPQAPDDPSKAIDQLVEQYTFAYRGEEDLEGRRVWVLEGTPRPDAPKADDPMAEMLRSRLTSVLVKIGKEDGWVYHFEMRGEPGSPPLQLRRYSNLRWNPELDPALFRFTPPADAKVQDMAGEAPATRPGGGR
ncbi:MAG: LolA family protein [Planctomycetota bacterium]